MDFDPAQLQPPVRQPGAHKGDFGTVIVCGGNATMPGAAAMCARAAFRTGAGLVKIASEAESLTLMLAIEPSATGVGLIGNAKHRIQQLNAADEKKTAVLAVGPGLGQSDAMTTWVQTLLTDTRRIVLDADGLNAFASLGFTFEGTRQPNTTILTPHPGEFRRLAEPLSITLDPTDPAQRPEAAATLAKKHGAVVVLKGKHVVVSDGERTWVRDKPGSPVLGTAGTGDVLTGCIASLWAQNMPAFDAACLAIRVGNDAADRWAQTHGNRGMLARELADALPNAMCEA